MECSPYKHLFALKKDSPFFEFCRVNHAGEFGAKMIYSAQIRALKLRSASKDDILRVDDFLQSELEHLSYFTSCIEMGASRPTIFLPLWAIMAYTIGMVSGLCGTNEINKCTVAVESVIESHYQGQVNYLRNAGFVDFEFLEKINKFMHDEVNHKDESLHNLTPGLTMKVYSFITILAIVLSEFA